MMKYIKRIMTLVLVLFLGLLASCGNQGETSSITTSEKNENYKGYLDLSYGEDKRNILDLYIPKNYKNDYIILFIHGGAWVAGDKNTYSSMMEGIASLGVACASMNYRYVSKEAGISDLLEDVSNAISFIKSYSLENLNISLNQMALFGYSSGAHLSLLYSYKNKDISSIPLKFVVSLAGPTDLTLDSFYDSSLSYTLLSRMIKKNFTQETKNSVLDDLLAISPISYVDEKTIPTLLVQGDLDDIVNVQNAIKLKEKLDLYHVPNQFVEYEDANHLLITNSDVTKTLFEKIFVFATNYFFMSE